MEFLGKLGKYKIVETEDQSKTLWSEYFNEACHSLSGAYSETIYNYIQGCSIAEQLKTLKTLHVFDVGFGLGLGLRALLDTIAKEKNIVAKKIKYTSIELDEELISWAISTNFLELTFQKQETFCYSSNFLTENDVCLEIQIFIGDARKTIPFAIENKLLPPVTAIFQDPFSPKKNPSLWTLEWFLLLKKISSPEVYLSTYSASVSIRKTMIKAGWFIENKKGFGQKKTMTKARLIGETSKALAAELSKSPTLELSDK